MSKKRFIDEYGDEYYSKEVNLKLIFNTYDKEIIEKDIGEMIWKLITDKPFDNLGWFDKNE